MYPVQEPKILTSDFADISSYFAIEKKFLLQRIVSPCSANQINRKLLFTLCRTCAEKQNQENCKCNAEKRCLLGTWCTHEIKKAIGKGYTIMKIYEVYHWDETSQFNIDSGDSGLFSEYINVFLKIKQEASG